MRIIGGKHGGRRFHPPTQMPARPTTDMAKEGLFNIIQNNLDIEELSTLDLFGGTGSISYELASRGCENLTLVEQDHQTVQFIKKTILELQFTGFQVLKMDVFTYIRNCTTSFDFIFAGPPYALKNIDDIPKLIFEKHMLKPGGWFVLEHTPRNNYEAFPYFSRAKNYGTTIFSIFINTNQDGIAPAVS
jgi:16S rRNA (guanine966-N2)-methyltransferase